MAEKPTAGPKRSFTLKDSQINTIAGAASGAIVSILVSPLDVVKTRIQVKRLPKGVPDKPLLLTIYHLGQREGPRAFYKGLGTTMLVSSRKRMYDCRSCSYSGLYSKLGHLLQYLPMVPRTLRCSVRIDPA